MKRLLSGVARAWMLSGIIHSAALAQPGPSGGGGASIPLENWPFSNTNWLSADGYSPLAFTNLSLAPVGDGNASVLIDSTTNSFLQYAVVENDGHTNVSLNGDGSLSLWFNPAWSSADQTNGSGPGGWARLFQIGEFTTNADQGCFSLYLSPDGQNLLFSAEDTNGVTTNYLAAPI